MRVNVSQDTEPLTCVLFESTQSVVARTQEDSCLVLQGVSLNLMLSPFETPGQGLPVTEVH